MREIGEVSGPDNAGPDTAGPDTAGELAERSIPIRCQYLRLRVLLWRCEQGGANMGWALRFHPAAIELHHSMLAQQFMNDYTPNQLPHSPAIREDPCQM